MIERFRVQNYKALKDVTLDLTPIHVLIGPNDSGKTSLLEAIAALCRSVDEPENLTAAFLGPWAGTSLVRTQSKYPGVALIADVTSSEVKIHYGVLCAFDSVGRAVTVAEELVNVVGEDPHVSRSHDRFTRVARLSRHPSQKPGGFENLSPQLHSLLSGVHYYRWVPRLLALPNAPDSMRRFRMEPTGFGLTLCLDDILGFDREAFHRLEDAFRGYFPQVKAIRLLPGPAFKSSSKDAEDVPTLQRTDGKGLFLQLVDGSLIPAAQVSDGLLLVLAYLAILNLPEPPRVLLIEEPENGIHPGRLADVLKVLRRLVADQSHTQVILTTHSPYVVDLFRPEEVTLCRKLEDGSVAVRRLSESETVRRQIDVFTLGEIWTAEGDDALAAPISEPVGSAA